MRCPDHDNGQGGWSCPFCTNTQLLGSHSRPVNGNCRFLNESNTEHEVQLESRLRQWSGMAAPKLGWKSSFWFSFLSYFFLHVSQEDCQEEGCWKTESNKRSLLRCCNVLEKGLCITTESIKSHHLFCYFIAFIYYLKVHFNLLPEPRGENSFRNPQGRVFPTPHQSPLAQSSIPITLFIEF